MSEGAVEPVPAGPIRARLSAPPSKSVTNRVLVAASLARGTSRIESPLVSDDTDRMAGCLRLLGARIDDDAGDLVVAGTGGALTAPAEPLEAGLSGTTLRYLTAVAALAPGPATITGAAPLLRRPVGALVAALRALGAEAADDGGYPPVRTAGGGIAGGAVTIDAAASSQFVTAVLLAAPYATRDVIVRAEGLGARAYVEMTVRLMREWGAAVDATPQGWRVAGGGRYEARTARVEYDASAAAHLLALAVATGGSVTVLNAAPDTVQPDAGITAVFEAMGATVRRDAAALTVDGPERPAPVRADLSEMPDQLSTIAALCALAPGRSTITGAAVARGHETDRIAATATELRRLGVGAEETADGLVIDGGEPSGAAVVQTYDDHRMAMAFAALAARVPGIAIAGPGVVSKTFPGFWDALGEAGVRLRRS